MRLERTCIACPEQYDVYHGKVKVGYLRLRHGHFTAELYGPGGKLVYESTTLGDGIFENCEREYHLDKAKEAIKKELDNDQS